MKVFSPWQLSSQPSVAPLRKPSATQAGFTLIELMVAIALALFIVAGLSVLFVNLKTTFTSQDQQAQVQDSQRLAMTMLTTTIQSAGYFTDPVHNAQVGALPPSTVANPDGTSFAAAQGIGGTSGTVGPAGTSDTLNVRYQTASGDGIMNCLGGSNPAGAPGAMVWVNSFAVNANKELTCAVNGGTAVALVSNVAQINLVYGVDTSGDGKVDTYLSANAITTANLWGSVHSAKLTVRFVNLIDSRAGAVVTLPQPWVQTVSLMNNT